MTDFPTLKLVIVDRDRIFALGLQAWLNERLPQYLELCSGTDDGDRSLPTLAVEIYTRPEPFPVQACTARLVIVGRSPEAESICRQCQRRGIWVLYLTEHVTTTQVENCEAWGLQGICPRGTEGEALVQVVAQVLAGETVWNRAIDLDVEISSEPLNSPINQRINQSGLSYINLTLARLDRRLQSRSLSQLDRWFLLGQRREVLAAKWIIDQFDWMISPLNTQQKKSQKTKQNLKTTNKNSPSKLGNSEERSRDAAQAARVGKLRDFKPQNSASDPELDPTVAISPRSPLAIALQLRQTCIERILEKLQGEFTNQTGHPLEIDILRQMRRQELLGIVLREFDRSLDHYLASILADLPAEQLTLQKLRQDRSQWFAHLWRSVVQQFYGEQTIGYNELPSWLEFNEMLRFIQLENRDQRNDQDPFRSLEKPVGISPIDAPIALDDLNNLEPLPPPEMPRSKLFDLSAMPPLEFQDSLLENSPVTSSKASSQTSPPKTSSTSEKSVNNDDQAPQLEGDFQQLSIAETVLAGYEQIRDTLLERIPFIPELLAYFLCEMPLVVDNITYAAGSAEALLRAQMLLENLIIQVANAAIQPLLDRLGDVEFIKREFYHDQLLSTRDIERFRNNLSWKYRWDKYVSDPTAIYESRYQIYVLDRESSATLNADEVEAINFTEAGKVQIKKCSIYAPRRQDFQRLNSLQQTITLVLETRDAITPRLRAIVSVLGTGLVYVLTQVIGRGLGLIGRGVLEGLGQANSTRNSKGKFNK